MVYILLLGEWAAPYKKSGPTRGPRVETSQF